MSAKPFAAASAEVAAQPARPQQPWRILIVDDNPDIVTVVRRVLTAQGYATLVAGDGLEALEMARKEMPDLILLDWMLPGIYGLEVCRQLKEDPRTRGIMILLVTGRGSIDSRVEGFDAGADDYIPKPFNHPELLARIRSALRLKKLADDLAERNRQLVESQSELIRSEKMATIGLLASGIAHEFNNIMAGISGYGQLAKRNPKYLPQLVEVALTQTERAMELTRSLATYNRRSSGQADCDVVSVLESALCLVKKEIESNGIKLVKEVSQVPRAAISPGQLQEVLLNLVINAIHAVSDSRGTITVRALHEPEKDKVRLEVIDTGIGIPKENIHRIFDPFFTTKGALGGGKQAGTGLGLSVCYNILQTHGGDISVESESGRGARFTVALPVRAEKPPETETAPQTGEVAASSGPLRILIVDDEGPIRAMLQEYLQDHEVVCCSSGEQAIEEYARRAFSHVILDICMQNSVDGLETLKRLKAVDREARVILASGRLPEEIDRADLELAYGHLLKPFQFEALAALLGLATALP
jgi:two-component system NtrC family sensor kinase